MAFEQLGRHTASSASQAGRNVDLGISLPDCKKILGSAQEILDRRRPVAELGKVERIAEIFNKGFLLICSIDLPCGRSVAGNKRHRSLRSTAIREPPSGGFSLSATVTNQVRRLRGAGAKMRATLQLHDGYTESEKRKGLQAKRL